MEPMSVTMTLTVVSSLPVKMSSPGYLYQLKVLALFETLARNLPRQFPDIRKYVYEGLISLLTPTWSLDHVVIP